MTCVQQTFPFEHTVEIQNGEQVADWQIFLCQDQLLVAMLDARELEMKAVLQVQVMFTRTETLQVVEQVKKYFGNKVYQTTIPRSIRVSEAPQLRPAHQLL